MDNFEPCKGLSSSNGGRGEADEGPSRALQGKTPDLEIAPNVLFFADEAPANNVRDPDTGACEFMTTAFVESTLRLTSCSPPQMKLASYPRNWHRPH